MVEVLEREVFRKLYTEERVVPPLMRWKAVKPEDHQRVYEESVRNVFSFWEREALRLRWVTRWSSVVEGNPPRVFWFTGARLSAYYNIIGKHRDTWIWGKVALLWEGEEGSARAITYSELDNLVEKIASSMKALGIKPGDWVIVYSPPTIEAVAAMLAATKIGAPFEPIFTGFGFWELAKRIRNRNPRMIFVSDGFYRRGKVVDTLSTLRRATEYSKYRGLIVVLERVGAPGVRENEVLLGDFIKYAGERVEDHVAVSSHPLFGLHSGYRDDYKPITHPAGGFLVQVYATSKWIGLRPHDTYLCTVWPGWITGISYVVFGPLMIGSTVLLYDGSPDYPSWNRWWDLVEDYAVTLFLTTGSALRLLSKRNEDYVKKHNMDTLRAILVTAEPLEADVWWWTYRIIGTGYTPIIDSVPGAFSGRIPVINTYIQSEVGTFIMGNLINYTFPPIAPGSAGPPIPGFHVALLRNGREIVNEGYGEVVLLKPWPSMPIEYPKEYVEKWTSNFYRTGDYAYLSKDGYFFVLGRIDGVLKVSGYRLSPGAVEKALREFFGVESRVLACLDEQRFEAPALLYLGDVAEEVIKHATRTLVGAISEPKLVVRVSSKDLFNKVSEKNLLPEPCSERLIYSLLEYSKI